MKTSNEEVPIVCSSDEQSNNTTCTRNNENENCQAEKCDVQPKQPIKDVQSKRPAILIQHKLTKRSKKQIVPQEDDKNCQSTDYYEAKMYTDKKCQADKNCQTTSVIRPKKPLSDMWSVTKKTDVQLLKPAVLHQYRQLSKHKNCQATVCEYNDSKSQSIEYYESKICSDKKCQEHINMQPVMPEMDMQLLEPAIRRMCSEKILSLEVTSFTNEDTKFEKQANIRDIKIQA